MKKRWVGATRVVLVSCLLLPLLGCPGDDDDDRAPGGDGGSDAVPSTSAGPCAVKCVDDLVSRCTKPAGACVGESSADFTSTAICYLNGVKYVLTTVGTTSTSRYYNPDGSLCYILESMPSPADITKVTATWKDAKGNVVATQMTDAQKKESTYRCADGTTYAVGSACFDMALATAAGGSACAPGTCK